MSTYQQALATLRQRFGRDRQFALATCRDNVPTLRTVDAYYEDGGLWIVTYAASRKVQDILENPRVALCHAFDGLTGRAEVMGHPLEARNREIRQTLIRVFEPWYFAHNNEQDANMCYVRVALQSGFILGEGVAYRVDFEAKSAEEIPFTPDPAMADY